MPVASTPLSLPAKVLRVIAYDRVQMTPREVEKNRRRAARKDRVPVGKAILYMAILSILFWWLAIEAYQFWTKLNLSPSTIRVIPIYAFAGGLLTGFCMAHSRSGRQAMAFAGAMVGLIFTLWMVSMLLGGFVILIGFSTDVADWVRDVAMAVGGAACAIVLVRLGAEVLMEKMTRPFKRT